MRFFNSNIVLSVSGILMFFALFMRLEHIFILDWLLLPAIVVFTICFVVKVISAVKTNEAK